MTHEREENIVSDPIIKDVEIIPMETRSTISTRYRTVTKAINREFRNIQSETQYSLYVGSYGRGTAIDASDIDILVELPEEEYNRHDSMKGNGQSRLLQAVKEAIINAYPRSDVRADGQVVKINFSDGMRFEILPAFKNIDWLGVSTYKYPDTNMGGNWRSTNPKAEQDAMKEKNKYSNELLYDTCKHIRRIRSENYSSYHLSGIVIDSFVYVAMGDWHWLWAGEQPTSTTGDFENALLNYFQNQNIGYFSTLTAPGSGESVNLIDSIDCLGKVLKRMAE